jgi:hypothetical protein
MSQRDKRQLPSNNNTAGVRERKAANRTRVAGRLDEIQGIVDKHAEVAWVGFMDWLDPSSSTSLCSHPDNAHKGTYDQSVAQSLTL